MRPVKIQLRNEYAFWIMPPINLNGENRISEQIDIDKLSEYQFEIIEKSIRNKDILIITAGGERITSSLNDINTVLCDSVDDEDIIDDEEGIFPTVVSVTCDTDDTDDNEEDEEIITKEDIEDAEILLKKNGNTVRATVNKLSKNISNKGLLMACLEVERNNKNRTGIISSLANIIERL